MGMLSQQTTPLAMMAMQRSSRLAFCIVSASLLATLSACGIAGDAHSGSDKRRDIATTVPLDEWVTDENGVNYAAGDRTDWKKIVVPRSGTLFVEVAVDEKIATIDVELFDRYGRLLLKKTRASGTTEHVRFEGEVTRGNYFVRIAARKSEDKSIYSLRASMQGGYGVGDIPRPE